MVHSGAPVSDLRQRRHYLPMMHRTSISTISFLTHGVWDVIITNATAPTNAYIHLSQNPSAVAKNKQRSRAYASFAELVEEAGTDTVPKPRCSQYAILGSLSLKAQIWILSRSSDSLLPPFSELRILSHRMQFVHIN